MTATYITFETTAEVKASLIELARNTGTTLSELINEMISDGAALSIQRLKPLEQLAAYAASKPSRSDDRPTTIAMPTAAEAKPLTGIRKSAFSHQPHVRRFADWLIDRGAVNLRSDDIDQLYGVFMDHRKGDRALPRNVLSCALEMVPGVTKTLDPKDERGRRLTRWTISRPNGAHA